MKIGFPKSTMPEEKRVALLPDSLKLIAKRKDIYFQKEYTKHLGVKDSEYRKMGANIISRSEMSCMDALCIPKPTQKDEKLFEKGMIIMGWPYIEDNRWFANAVVEKSLTVIDFHYMYNEQEFVFKENCRIAGMLGMMQAMPEAGRPPHQLGNVAVIGKGNVSKGAIEVLDKFEVSYNVFDSKNVGDFFATLDKWDVVVNCIKWYEDGYFITSSDINKMKKGAFIIDISSEGIEGSVPHSIHKPTYNYKHIKIYNNCHIPTLWPMYASEQISKALAPIVNDLLNGVINPVLRNATVVVSGKATDERARPAVEQAKNLTISGEKR